MAAQLNIRPFKPSDSEAIWQIFSEVIKSGETYVFTTETTKEEAIDYFTSPKNKCFIAEFDNKIAGFYAIRKNRVGLGDHIGNASYMISPYFQGKGIGKALGKHSIEQAKKDGFSAMQFNFVVSTNLPAVNLWKSLGFNIIGTIPKAFRHSKLGLVDAYIMHLAF
ncbi:MAG: GNAT family N-acetyltransferase [Rickettsiales bacterium]|nr:GNAT family N-acetyltransferase [Rickettsiales bacterium]